MKLKLPNGDSIKLDTSLPLEERKEVVDRILKEWNSYFESSWELINTKVCLDVLSNYLCLVKDGNKKNKEDKYIMSVTKIKHMQRGNAKSSNFSCLPQDQRQLLGLVDHNNDESSDY
jgi:23S rRNA A2030 N6-methylase RlmJ